MGYDGTQEFEHPDFDPNIWFEDPDPNGLLTFDFVEPLHDFQFQTLEHSPDTEPANTTSRTPLKDYPNPPGGEIEIAVQDISLPKPAPVSNPTSARDLESIQDLLEKPMDGENTDESPVVQTRHSSMTSDTVRYSASHIMEYKYSNQVATTFSQSLTATQQDFSNTGETVDPQPANVTGQIENYLSLPALHNPIPGPRTGLQTPGFSFKSTTADNLQSLEQATAELCQPYAGLHETNSHYLQGGHVADKDFENETFEGFPESSRNAVAPDPFVDPLLPGYSAAELSQSDAGFNDINSYDPQDGHVANKGLEDEAFEGFPESPRNAEAPLSLSPHHSSSSQESCSDVELIPIVRKVTDCDRKKPWVRLNVTKGMNYRAAKIEAYRPERAYAPIPYAPSAWGDRYKYTYHSSGELIAPAFYSSKEILTFIFQNPAHRQIDGQSGFRLWIQRNPPDSARRYGQAQASRCRFRDCPAPNRSIIRGQVRVAFDELSFAHPRHDPQHNAGYVHLYCIEKFLDFPAICYLLDVRVDERVLPKEPDGRNRMMLPSHEEKDIASTFLTICKTGERPPNYPYYKTPNRPYENTLTHYIMKARLRGELDMHKKQRAERGTHGKSVADHLGNLEAHLGVKVEYPKRKRLSTKATTRKKQRKMYDHDSEDDAEGETEEEAIVVKQEQSKASRRWSQSQKPRRS